MPERYRPSGIHTGVRAVFDRVVYALRKSGGSNVDETSPAPQTILIDGGQYSYDEVEELAEAGQVSSGLLSQFDQSQAPQES